MSNEKFITDESGEYILTHEGKEIFKGTENACYMKLQRSQSQSADWAIKYEGWKVEPVK